MPCWPSPLQPEEGRGISCSPAQLAATQAPESSGWLWLLNAPWGFSRMGPRAGQRGEGTLLPTWGSGGSVPPCPGTPGSDYLLPGFLLEKGFGMYNGESWVWDGRVAIITMTWQDSLGTWPWWGAKVGYSPCPGHLGLGPLDQPAAPGSLWCSLPRIRFWVHWGQLGGAREEGGLGCGHVSVAVLGFLAGSPRTRGEQRLG